MVIAGYPLAKAGLGVVQTRIVQGQEEGTVRAAEHVCFALGAVRLRVFIGTHSPYTWATFRPRIFCRVASDMGATSSLSSCISCVVAIPMTPDPDDGSYHYE